jgi:CBS domain-containing protein
MFAMYDDDGLNFRSTIDRLYNINEVDRSERIHNRQNDDPKKNFEQNLKETKVTREAKEKYKQIANLDTSTEVFHVDQVMSHPVITIEGSKSIQECYEIMKEHNVQQLPISADNGIHLKGMVTLHNILEFLTGDIDYAKVNITKAVETIAAKGIITTDPVSDIRRVAKVMNDFNLNAIPVVNENDILVGIVSRNDIIKAVASFPHLQMWA